MEHPADEVLLRFLLGETSREENRAIVIHLLSGCPRCAAVLRQLPPPEEPEAYDKALDRLEAAVQELAAGDEEGRLARFLTSGGATRKRPSG